MLQQFLRETSCASREMRNVLREMRLMSQETRVQLAGQSSMYSVTLCTTQHMLTAFLKHSTYTVQQMSTNVHTC